MFRRRINWACKKCLKTFKSLNDLAGHWCSVHVNMNDFALRVYSAKEVAGFDTKTNLIFHMNTKVHISDDAYVFVKEEKAQ